MQRTGNLKAGKIGLKRKTDININTISIAEESSIAMSGAYKHHVKTRFPENHSDTTELIYIPLSNY